MVHFQTDGERILMADAQTGEPLGGFRVLLMRPGNDNYWNPFHMLPASVKEGELVFQTRSGSVTLTLRYEEAPDGLAATLAAAGEGKGVVRLLWDLPEDDYFPFVPAFMYGVNRGGASKWATYPQLEEGDNGGFHRPWVAPEWLVRTDRSSHGFTSMLGKKRCFALGGRDICRRADGSVNEKTGIGVCKSERRISFSLGFVNDPFTYSTIPGRNRVSRTEGFADFENGGAVCDLRLYLLPGGDRLPCASALLRASYRDLRDSVKENGTVEDAARAIADALCDYGYDKDARNFYITLPDVAKNPDAEPFAPGFSASWTGGARTAYPLLTAGLRLGEEKWTDCAVSVLDHIADCAVSEQSGLFHENYDPVKKEWNARGWWYRDLEMPGHSAYVNGQTCYYLLASYKEAGAQGREKESWLSAASRVLHKVMETQLESGSFGYTYRESDGSLLDPDGFSSCWFVPGLVLLWECAQDKAALAAAERAMDFYWGEVKTFHLYGGPHDIFKSPDEEGVLAFIKAAELLHRLTGGERYLQMLSDGVEYEFSWKFSYNPVLEAEPLRSMHWAACGGSVTSVNNSHIHPMGSAILKSLSYLAEQTKDPYFADRYRDTLYWTSNVYLHEDGEYDWGKKGLINGRFCYSDSLLAERYPDGSPSSTWFCAHSWASGAVLEGVAELLPEKKA